MYIASLIVYTQSYTIKVADVDTGIVCKVLEDRHHAEQQQVYQGNWPNKIQPVHNTKLITALRTAELLQEDERLLHRIIPKLPAA